MSYEPQDVKPYTVVAAPDREGLGDGSFPLELVAPVVGMSVTFIRRVLDRRALTLTPSDVLTLLDQDAFSETFVPRSRVLPYLHEQTKRTVLRAAVAPIGLLHGSALDLLPVLPLGSVQAVVTSTPYWAMRIYDDMVSNVWADGEVCPFGMEQTPEGFVRHSVEILAALRPAMKEAGSVWWNLGDSYNTRTQIRSNAAEALRAMQGKDSKRWHEHAARRYSAGHSYLKDGEQTMIPFRIAERASRIGYYVKSMITWVKSATTPEPQLSRVSRTTEQIIHLAVQRTPHFVKERYLSLDPGLGGRNPGTESAKLGDAWMLNTSSGRGGHGAQFPLALPGRCIGLSSEPGDLVLDPFMGSGTTAVAAKRLDRNYLGFDVSGKYLEIAQRRIDGEPDALFLELEDVV